MGTLRKIAVNDLAEARERGEKSGLLVIHGQTPSQQACPIIWEE
jgi:hypothetical protein